MSGRRRKAIAASYHEKESTMRGTVAWGMFLRTKEFNPFRRYKRAVMRSIRRVSKRSTN